MDYSISWLVFLISESSYSIVRTHLYLCFSCQNIIIYWQIWNHHHIVCCYVWDGAYDVIPGCLVNILYCILPFSMPDILHINLLPIFINQYIHRRNFCGITSNSWCIDYYSCVFADNHWLLRIGNRRTIFAYRITYKFSIFVHIANCVAKLFTTTPLCIQSHVRSDLLVFDEWHCTCFVNIPT